MTNNQASRVEVAELPEIKELMELAGPLARDFLLSPSTGIHDVLSNQLISYALLHGLISYMEDNVEAFNYAHYVEEVAEVAKVARANLMETVGD